jgi:Ca-activated chloride channel homolog
MLAPMDQTTRLEVAKRIFNQIVDSLSALDQVEMALRVFGHQSPVPPQDCEDTRLEVPFAENNAARIRQKVNFIEARGTTPIANSLIRSANDFPPCTDCRNVIVLITDGIEACDGDPCLASRELQRMGVVVKPFVIGLQLDANSKDVFDCVGDFYEAENEAEFTSAMKVIISKALNATTTQINLLDDHNHPTETDVTVSLFDREFNRPMYQYVHTINQKGFPDTLYLDDRIMYRMVVHTLPQVSVDSIRIISGTHNIISANAGRGKLLVTQRLASQPQSFDCIIRQAGTLTTLAVQKTGEENRYLTGKYDVEILSLPRILIRDVEISQSHTTTVEIPRTGFVTIYARNLVQGSIFVVNEDGLDWVYDLNPLVSSEILMLMPGQYRIVYRPRYSRRITSTTSRSFEVESGRTIRLEL